MATKQKFKQGGESAYGYSSETDHLVEFNKTNPVIKKKRRTCLCYGSVLLLIVLVGIITLGTGIGLGLNFGLKSTTLPSRITTSNLMNHLQDFEDSARGQEKFSRAVQYGYNDSAELVYNKLRNAGFKEESLRRQTFTVATYEENSEGSSLSASFVSPDGQEFNFEFLRDSQYSVMWYSNTTEGMAVTRNLTFVEEQCNSDNYTSNTIALINYIADEEEAGCSLLNMTDAAHEAGVVGVIMMRTEDFSSSSPPTTRLYYQDGDSFLVSKLPVMGATYQLGKQLRDFIDLSNTGTVLVSMSTDTIVNFWETYNVLAETSNHEKSDSIIVIGSHLDSVAAGPGINDNGSGSAANLELAIQIVKNAAPVNKVVFAFWGAEELGLLGSTHYVSTLDEEMMDNIALNLNFDMIGSPNYNRMIYNGSGAENENIVQASRKIQLLFEEFFQSESLNYTLTPFNGRSDYGPFIAEGVDIPAGGLATGADGLKTEEERIMFGGLANTILDPCYHQACDTIYNINQEVYLQMSQAAAYVLNECMMMEDLKGYLNGG